MNAPKNGSNAVKIILAIGSVVIAVMVVGFVGVFMLMKYNNEQALREEEQKQTQAEKRERSESFGALGNLLGDQLADKFASELGEDDLETLRGVAANLGESLGKKLSEAKSADDVRELLKSAGESVKTKLDEADSDPDHHKAE